MHNHHETDKNYTFFFYNWINKCKTSAKEIISQVNTLERVSNARVLTCVSFSDGWILRPVTLSSLGADWSVQLNCAMQWAQETIAFLPLNWTGPQNQAMFIFYSMFNTACKNNVSPESDRVVPLSWSLPGCRKVTSNKHTADYIWVICVNGVRLVWI